MKVVRDARQLTGSGVVSLAMTSARALLVLRLLGPAVLGIWKTVMLLYMAATALRLGVLRAMSLRVPLFDGQGRHEEAERAAETAGGFMLLLGGVSAVAVAGAALLVHDPRYRLALLFMAAILFIAQPLDFLRQLAPSQHRFSLRANEMLLTGATDLVFASVLSWRFGLAGIAGAVLITVTGPLLYLWHGNGFHYPARFSLRGVRRLAGVGFPYMAAESALYYLRYLDVLIVSLLLGPVYVGYYGLAVLVLDFSTSLTRSSISQLVMPHLMREYGRRGSAAAVAGFYEVPSRLISYTVPPLLGVVALMIPTLVRRFLPQYVPGIEAAQIVLAGGFFLALHASLSSFLSAAKQIPATLHWFGFLMPVSALAQVVVIRAGFGLVGVAAVSVLMLGAGLSGELVIARRACGERPAAIARYLGSLYLPLAYTAVLVLGLSRWDAVGRLGAWAGAPVVAAGVLVLLCAPLVWIFESQFGLLKAARESS